MFHCGLLCSDLRIDYALAAGAGWGDVLQKALKTSRQNPAKWREADKLAKSLKGEEDRTLAEIPSYFWRDSNSRKC